MDKNKACTCPTMEKFSRGFKSFLFPGPKTDNSTFYSASKGRQVGVLSRVSSRVSWTRRDLEHCYRSRGKARHQKELFALPSRQVFSQISKILALKHKYQFVFWLKTSFWVQDTWFRAILKDKTHVINWNYTTNGQKH